MDLIEILESYPTDKIANGFGPIYEALFSPLRYTTVSILEIGIFKGGSLRAWRDYFPNATVFGLDIEKTFVHPLEKEERIEARIVDAADHVELSKWIGKKYFDIIIDDGSHRKSEILAAFDILWPRLYPGGIYSIEDIKIDAISISELKDAVISTYMYSDKHMLILRKR